MPAKALFLGLDLGTSGARAVVIDGAGMQVASHRSALGDHGTNHRDPRVWWAAAQTALKGALAQVDAQAVRALAVDGTSGTMLGAGCSGNPPWRGADV